MANWCSTSYVIEGDKEILETIEQAFDNHPVKENSNENWEGNILAALGIDCENSSIRGFVIDKSEIKDDIFSFVCEEAWCRTDFAELLLEKFPSISIYWMEEEPGCEVFRTNDAYGVYFPDRYYVDIQINSNWESEYFEEEQDAYNWIRERTGCQNAADIEKFNEEAMKNQTDNYICFHEFDII